MPLYKIRVDGRDTPGGFNHLQPAVEASKLVSGKVVEVVDQSVDTDKIVFRIELCIEGDDNG